MLKTKHYLKTHFQILDHKNCYKKYEHFNFLNFKYNFVHSKLR